MVRIASKTGLRSPEHPLVDVIETYGLFCSRIPAACWIPDNRIFSVHPPHALDLIMDYLTQVGTMLKDGNFREAKRDAKNSKAAFDKAYAQHRLT